MPIASINPATGLTVREFDAHTDDEVEGRIAQARAAFEALADTDFATRAGWMRAAAGQLEADLDTIAPILTLEMGKTLVQARAEVLKSAKAMRRSCVSCSQPMLVHTSV